MRNIVAPIVIGVLWLVFIIGCHKGDNSPAYIMKARINDSVFTGNNCYAATNDSGKLSIATTTRLPYIFLTVNKGYAGVGTYTFDGVINFSQIDSVSGWGYISAYGTLSITSTNPLTGTFSFTCQDSTKVTEGSFVAKTD